MRQFTDAKGDRWTVAVSGATIKRCQDLLKVDLGDPLAGDPPLLTRIDLDIVFLVDLVYVVCKPDADAKGLTDVQFAERLEGDALREAHDAFLEDLADFFHRFGRDHVAAAIQRQQEVVDGAVRLAEETVRSEQMTKVLNGKLEGLGKSFASLLESPESSPSPGPSAS